MSGVVVTGIGLITPLGHTPQEVTDRILRGDRAARPHPFSSALACRQYAPVEDFDADEFFPDNKTLRLMNRDAQMAAAAARLAMRDAGVVPDTTYPGDDIALYGATGLSGMPIEETARLVRHAAAPDGTLDLRRFGEVALKRIRPVWSFKILANMPICFVSIFEDLRGPNAVFTPWEGQGAQAIAAGFRAIRRGEVPCALVGGCDVKTHALAMIALEQLGAFESWNENGQGCIPGEGAAFLVLENEQEATARHAHIYARLVGQDSILPKQSDSLHLVSASDAPHPILDEQQWLDSCGPVPPSVLFPKPCLGNLFAAAAAVQVAVAAAWAKRSASGQQILARCCGFGADPAAFLLEAQ